MKNFFVLIVIAISVVIIVISHAVARVDVVIQPSPLLNEMLSPANPANYNPAFKPWEQWTGGDCDVSTALDADHVLFIFGDTLVGNFSSKTKRNADPFPPGAHKMPHSTVGVFNKKTKSLKKWWGQDFGSLLAMPHQDKSMYYWPSGVTPMFNDSVCIVGEQVNTLPGVPGDWNFVTNGTWVVCLSNLSANLDAPEKWAQKWSQIPHSGNRSAWNHEYSIEWREAVRMEPRDGLLYLFGNYVLSASSSDKAQHQILARISPEAMLKFDWAQLEFLVKKDRPSSSPSSWRRDAWNNNKHVSPFAVTDLMPLWSGQMMSIPEFTCEYDAQTKMYFVLFIPAWSRVIEMRVAPSLEGPWSGANTPYPRTVAKLPPYTSNVFCYALKFHAALDDVVNVSPQQKKRRAFSYVCNTNKLSSLYEPGYGEVYTPRFMTLEL